MKLFELSSFEPFELSNFQTPWVSNFPTPSSQTFELEPEGCSANPYSFSSGPAPCSLAQHVAAASNFQAGSPFKLSSTKLAPTFKLENFKLFILQAFQIFKLSNLVQHEFEKPLVTPLTDLGIGLGPGEDHEAAGREEGPDTWLPTGEFQG